MTVRGAPDVFCAVQRTELSQRPPVPAVEPLDVALARTAGPILRWHEAIEIVLVPRLLRGLWRQRTPTSQIAMQVATVILAALRHRPLRHSPDWCSPTAENEALVAQIEAMQRGTLSPSEALGPLLERLRGRFDVTVVDVDAEDSAPEAPASRVRPRASSSPAPPAAVRRRTVDWGPVVERRAPSRVGGGEPSTAPPAAPPAAWAVAMLEDPRAAPPAGGPGPRQRLSRQPLSPPGGGAAAAARPGPAVPHRPGRRQSEPGDRRRGALFHCPRPPRPIPGGRVPEEHGRGLNAIIREVAVMAARRGL